jgi:hypothetical protein
MSNKDKNFKKHLYREFKKDKLSGVDIDEEFKLIQEKRSLLPAQMRDLVCIRFTLKRIKPE